MSGNQPEKPQFGFYTVPYLAANDERLSPLDEKVFGYILALSLGNGYCYASSNYLAEMIGKSRVVITRSIKKLEVTGYIVKQVTRPGYGQAERKIYPLVDRMGNRIADPFSSSTPSSEGSSIDGSMPSSKDSSKGSSIDGAQGSEHTSTQVGVQGSTQGSTQGSEQDGVSDPTVGSKTNLLENSDKSLDIGPEDSFTVGSKTNLSVGSKTNHNIYKTYIEKNNKDKEKKKFTRERMNDFPPPFDKLTDKQQAKLSSYQQTMSEELVNFEIERVANRQTAPKNPFAYLVAILNDLQAKGITTLEQAMADHQEEYKQQEFEGEINHGQSKAKPYRRQKKGRKVEQLPAWAADDYQPETGQVTQEEADRLGDLINDVAAKKDPDPNRPQWLDDDVPF